MDTPPQREPRPDSVFFTNARGEIVFSNRYPERVVGRRLTDIADDFPMFHLDGRPYSLAERQVPRAIASGEAVVDEDFYGREANGSRVRYRCSCWPVLDDGGQVAGTVSATRDVTAEHWRETELAYHASLLDNVDDAVVGTDAGFRLTVWNRGAEQLYGFTAEEVLGRPVREVISYAGDRARRDLERELLETDPARTEITAYRKDGTPVDVELVSTAVRDAAGAVAGYLGIHRDVSERKRTERSLRAANRQRETILESITDAFCALDRGWRFTYVNDLALRRIEEVMGRRVGRDEVLGAELWEMFPNLVGTDVERRYRQAMRDGRPAQFETRAATDDWVDVHVYPSENGLSIYYRIVTERKRIEQELRESHRRIEAILGSISDAFCALDRGWRFTYVNDLALRRIEEVMGRRVDRDELLGAELWAVFPQLVGTDFERRYRQAMRDGRPAQFETRAAADDWVEVHVYPSASGLSIYLHDISSRKRAAEERDRRAHQQALVAGLGLRALANDDLQALLDEAVAAVEEGLQATSAGLAEMLPGGQALVLRAGVGWQEAAVGTGRLSAARGSLEGYTVMTGEPVVSQDVEADPRFALSPFVRGYAPASAAAVVITGRHGPFGALTVLSRTPHPFSADDVNFLQAVANVVSAAIERANAERLTLDVRQAERTRMARDLHDEALQDLTDALAQASAAGEDDAAERLTRLIPALKGAGRQVRAAINDLRLDAEGDRPIADLLEELVSVQREFATDLRIELVIDPGVPDGALGNAGTQLMRVAGEALVNARRHSGARTVTVRVWTEADHLRVEVSDDGHGFAAGAEARPGSTGIRGMRERLDLVRGDIAINSTAAGTTVRLGVPLGAGVGALAHGTRILLVEDHAAVREAIAVMFDRAAGFEVVGQAGSLAEARTMLENVDVALVDLGLPDGFGGDLIKELRDVNPRAQALVLSAGLQRRETARAIESGAAGALDKTVSLDEVVDAVRRVQAGGTLVPLDEVVELLRLAARERDREHRDREAIESLSPREREVLQLLADGLDTPEIAGRLHIAARTERNHVASIFGKLNVHSRLQAVLFALRHGIVKVH